MGRVALQIDKSALETQVKAAEATNGGPFANRSELARAIEESDWARKYINPTNDKPKSISASVINARINEYGIEPQTPKGKRGAGLSGNRGKRTSRAEKFAKSVPISMSLRILNNNWRGLRDSSLDKINDGSMKAAVGLKCFDCAGGETTAEVARCSTYGCSLWPHRPYRNKSGLEVLAARGDLDGLSDQEAMKLVRAYDNTVGADEGLPDEDVIEEETDTSDDKE